MKINLKQPILTLKGEQFEEDDKNKVTLGVALANLVLAPHKDKKGFRPLKAYELAQKFNTLEEVEIDMSDLLQIKEIIEDNTTYLPIILAQVQQMIINAEQEIKTK